MNKQQNYQTFKPDYELQRSKIETFLQTFEDNYNKRHPIHENRKYMIMLVFNFLNFLASRCRQKIESCRDSF